MIKNLGSVANATSGTVTSVGLTSTGATVTITGATSPITGSGTYNIEVATPAPAAANPTAKVGATVVNGTATTYMRSDASPPLDLTVSYSFTASQTITTAPAANTSNDGLILQDTTPAAAASQQFSPRIRWTGQGWKTTATAASQEVDFIAEAQPVQGSAAPSGNWVLSAQINGGGYAAVLTVSNTGAVSIPSSVTMGRALVTATTPVGIGLYSPSSGLGFSVGATGVGSFDSSGSFHVLVAGQGLTVKEGSNAKQGTSTLSGGTVVVSNTSVTANSRIFITAQSLGTVSVPSAYGVSARTAGTSFTILASVPTDTSVVAWEIFEPG